MSGSGLLIDTGPLVALLNAKDEYHAICLAQARGLRGPFFTSWPVVTEAAYLLRDYATAVQKLLEWIRTGEIQILQIGAEDADGIAQILKRYADQSFDFADAVLMHLADRESMLSVFTIDHRHFGVYRTSSRQKLSLIPSSLEKRS